MGDRRGTLNQIEKIQKLQRTMLYYVDHLRYATGRPAADMAGLLCKSRNSEMRHPWPKYEAKEYQSLGETPLGD